jgi:hypothetical protein
MKMFLPIAILALAAIAIQLGCVSPGAKVRTCGVVLLVDGQQTWPSVKQFQAIQRALGDEFERRSLKLVPDITSSDLLATIECRPRPENDAQTDLIVRDVTVNTFTATSPKSNAVRHPSLEQVEWEQAQAMRGLSRPGIDD